MTEGVDAARTAGGRGPRTGSWDRGEAASGALEGLLRTDLASWAVTWGGPTDHEESHFLIVFHRSMS